MTFTNIKRLLPVLAVLMVVIGQAGKASAATCTADLVQCYQDAAALDGWFSRSVAGLDCEITFAGCVRETLLGI
ncbi:MAG TPA: hypothetical protein VKH42_07025 [Vicinamibacterales bacterium]|nr:hypothetical protein [Vicinamibacterales bacterium]